MLAHGGGGSLTGDLIKNTILPALGRTPGKLSDSAPVPGFDGLYFTTDAYVVKPPDFPGGNIGSLAVHGTLNDLAVCGAKPLAVALSLVIEEGLEKSILEKALQCAGSASRMCGVPVVTGDTKVVARNEADGLFITTSGVGRLIAEIRPSEAEPGDCVILSGSAGDHGIAVLSAREGIEFETIVRSDSAPVWPMVEALINENITIHAMRDPTRGGIAASLNELADASDISIVLEEKSIPVKPAVSAACEMLGLNPLSVANEGKIVFLVPETEAQHTLDTLHALENGADAAIIGKAVVRRNKAVYLKTVFGTERTVEMPYGEELPRIC